LGHEKIATLTSYGKLSPHRSAEAMGFISLEELQSKSPLLGELRGILNRR